MNSPSANGVAAAKRHPLKSLAARLTDPGDREAFAELVSWIDTVPPTDEVARIAQLLGFLTLFGRELPEALASERTELRELLLKARAEFDRLVQKNVEYHDKLNERLTKLPAEIAQGVNPGDIARTMAESFRQQIATTGIQETQGFLIAATADLKRLTYALDQAVKPISDRYGNIGGQLETQVGAIEAQSKRLIDATTKLQKKHSELLEEVRKWEWRWILTAIFCLLLIGAFLGSGWVQRRQDRNTADGLSAVEESLSHLQQTVDHLSQAAPPSKHAKGANVSH